MTPDSLTYAAAHQQAGNLIGNICLALAFIGFVIIIVKYLTDIPVAVSKSLWREIRKGKV